MSGQYVVALADVDETQIALVGGKAARLGALRRLDGVRVPDGFCITTQAFHDTLAATQALADDAPDPARLRAIVESVGLPAAVTAEITAALATLCANTSDGGGCGVAVRSSATAEDLPEASFAGQHDSFLDVVGEAEVLRHVTRCWASLFTDRAVAYRARNGIDHRQVRMAVVVQRMVRARTSGVLFTADPLTGHRRTSRIEAVAGLGEALVSGRTRPDTLTVRDGVVLAREHPGGGAVLADGEALELDRLGRRIEAHLAAPQDLEWCLDGDGVQVVQSRPITTLFPVPPVADDRTHVYLSVGHQQMMTDPMAPLGLSFWQLTTPAPMVVCGGRLFVDVTERLAAPQARAGLLDAVTRSDPLTGDAVRTLLDREGVVGQRPDQGEPPPLFARDADPLPTDPAIVTGLIDATQASISAAAQRLRDLSGTDLLDAIRDDLQELRRVLFDRRSHQVFLSAMEAAWWVNDHVEEWLGDRNASDPLTQSVPHNITSQMGLDLLDVADAIRPHPEVIAFLRRVAEGTPDGGTAQDGVLDRLTELPGGGEAQRAISAWLARYGMRCVGEIDITRPRWSERPRDLVPLLLANVRNFTAGEARRRFDQGLQVAAAAERDLLRRLGSLDDGATKVREVKDRIDRIRTFIGYREYPKYGMVSRYFVYKQALLREAARLVRAGVLREAEDIFWLTVDELDDVVATQRVDHALIARRRADFRGYQALRTPRVLTSDGEVLSGSYRRGDLPDGALAGLPVSAGTVEGRARVVLDVARADLQPGDVLVTTHTDPSWTPLFVSAAALVTEVGGAMTHGAVIAREYGLPAVVSVPDATRLLRDGQRIRVDGTTGVIEPL